jgi:hypothetical protein
MLCIFIFKIYAVEEWRLKQATTSTYKKAEKATVVRVHAMKACRGSRGISPPILNLCTRWRWVGKVRIAYQLWHISSVFFYYLENIWTLGKSCIGRIKCGGVVFSATFVWNFCHLINVGLFFNYDRNACTKTYIILS